MRRGIFVAPFDELSHPRVVADLAAAAEERGFDGFFVWDHVRYAAPVREVADPWVVLSAVALATRRIELGPLVTPLPRRRVHKLARETVTLDRLSDGRLVLGAGLGSDNNEEFTRYETVTEPRERAELLDDGLERLLAFWDGEFEPRPVRQPRIPIWLAARWPSRRPVRRAARFDGLFPIEMPGPDALAELVAEVAELRGGIDPARPFDVVVTEPAGADPGPWEAAGATWLLTGFDRSPRLDEVRAAIDAGP
jgi:alkanesulfonate monooxygenase SsuD/methylene tetrahydromethanopterin reductase-like flavin-dependent oxidoreductase (luciferase family)